jgi:hypothetical protein
MDLYAWEAVTASRPGQSALSHGSTTTSTTTTATQGGLPRSLSLGCCFFEPAKLCAGGSGRLPQQQQQHEPVVS